MLRRRRKFATALASLAMGAAPLGLLAQDTYYTPSGEVCPPGYEMPLPQYGPQGTPPAGSMPSQPTPQSMPPAPSQPTSPGQAPSSPPSPPQAPGRAQVGDQPQQPQQSQQSQQPQTATPTVNPSSGGQTSTAATSPQASAPNMIGDLFGTGNTQHVIITPAPFLQTPAAFVVPFASQSELISFLPFGVSTPSSVAPNVEFDTLMNTFNGTDHITGLPVAQTISPSTFTSQLPTGAINGGLPLSEHVGPSPNLLTNPPAADSMIELDQGTAPYQADVEAFSLATKPGLAAQEQAFVGTNGQGTFSGQAGESVTIQNAVAVLNNDNGPIGLDPSDEFYHQQIVTYDPGTQIFQPVDVIFAPPPIIIDLPGLGGLPGANVGRQKLTENTSPLPQDRVFVNYSHFAGTPLAAGGVDVNRVTPGFEKTFFDGLMSIELRAPFASTLGSDFTAGSLGNTNETEFGNMALWWKTLLWQDPNKSIAGGLGVSLPTADDVTVMAANGNTLLKVDNRSAHFLPYIGGVWVPEPRMFITGICQFDIDTSGNPAQLSDFIFDQPTGRLHDVGNPNDADFVFVDMQFGYWMYQNHLSNGFVKGFAPLVELHYNRAIDDGDDVVGSVDGASILVRSTQKTDQFNGLVGATALLKHNASLMLAYSTPIGNNDAQFDGEFRVSFNWYFGGLHEGGTNFGGLGLTR